jgi:hypothetical protein
MAVYVDHQKNKFGRMIMCHMLADSIEELMAMADNLGLHRRHFQPWSHPHFDISLGYRGRAVKLGAVEVTRRELVDTMKRYRALIKVSENERDLLAFATVQSDLGKKRARVPAE